MNDKVLVVAVHPDDETLGCGGTLLKHKANGDQTNWLIATTLPKNHSHYDSREMEIEHVASKYCFDDVFNLRLNTMRVDEYSMNELIGLVSRVVKKVKPNIIYLPFKSDVHSDHRKIFEAAYSCTKVFRYPHVKRIYMMETLSETDFSPSLKEESFVPNVFSDISPFMEQKIEIMRIYKGELGTHPFPRSERSIEALATVRGAAAGCEFAEGFMLLKEIR